MRFFSPSPSSLSVKNTLRMGEGEEDDEGVYEEVDISEMTYEEDEETYYYECPCGDMFEITKVNSKYVSAHPSHRPRRLQHFSLHLPQEQLANGETIAHCPSCSLTIRVILPNAEEVAEEVAEVVEVTCSLAEVEDTIYGMKLSHQNAGESRVEEDSKLQQQEEEDNEVWHDALEPKEKDASV